MKESERMAMFCPEALRAEVRQVNRAVKLPDASKIIGGAQLGQNEPMLLAAAAVNIMRERQGNEIVENFALCVGRFCNHWRWSEVRLPDAPPAVDGGEPIVNDQTARHGYCGLSGKPEFTE